MSVEVNAVIGGATERELGPCGLRGAVLVAEDHAPLRSSLVSVLQRAGFFAAGATTGKEAIELLRQRKFDVLLADINMPGNASLELLITASEASIRVPVVLMTGEPSVETAVGALREGAIDYLTKPFAPEALLARLDLAVQKSRALAAENDPLAGLTASELARISPREQEITRLLARGNPAKDVAVMLALSPNTVRNHVKSIFAKLQVHSQVELLLKLRRDP